MLRRGAARPGQVLPHQLLQMPCMPEFSGPGRVLLQRRRLLLHQRLPGPFRHQMLSLRTVRRGGSGHRSGEDVPQQLFHLRPLQVIAVFFLLLTNPQRKNFFFTTTTTTTTTQTHRWTYMCGDSGWMRPSGSLTGRSTLLSFSFLSPLRGIICHYFVIPSCGFWGEAVKRKWSTVPNHLCRLRKIPTTSFLSAGLKTGKIKFVVAIGVIEEIRSTIRFHAAFFIFTTGNLGLPK